MEMVSDNMGLVITIDGPAASGKTSVSRELARRLRWNWVSTGAFYRGLAYVAGQMGTDLNSEKALAELARRTDLWSVEMRDEQTHVFFRGQDVTQEIFREEVGSVASKVSHFPLVRSALLEAQRECQRITSGLVAEGRDCGTVVFPQAEAKIYLTAKEENRAERRAREQGVSTEQIAQDQKVRDQQDSSRKTAPLQVPSEALVLDSTDLPFDEVVQRIEQFVRPLLKTP